MQLEVFPNLSLVTQKGTKRRPESRYLLICKNTGYRLTAGTGLTEDLLLNCRLQKLQILFVGIKPRHDSLRNCKIIGVVADIHAHHSWYS